MFKRDTLMFNGHADEVAHLDRGRNLHKYFLMPLPASLTRRQLGWCKTAHWLLCLMPLARLTFLGLAGGLGVNPIEFITPSTGTWGLVGLLATLAITSLR